MDALEQPLGAGPPPILDTSPLPALAALALGWTAVVALAAAGLVTPVAADVAGLAAAHGALLGTALAWTAPPETDDRWAPLEAAALVTVAATWAQVAVAGWLAWAAVPAWALLRRPAWARTSVAGLAGGAVFGLLLGGHLLVTAALTLGHGVREPALDLGPWWGYDVGANVLAAEAFFRGALFTRAHRRWTFPLAAAAATAASVARYLVDPLLPRAVEMIAGAAFYLALLGAGNCWLVARTGSLLPALAASTLFFAAYRLLGAR